MIQERKGTETRENVCTHTLGPIVMEVEAMLPNTAPLSLTITVSQTTSPTTWQRQFYFDFMQYVCRWYVLSRTRKTKVRIGETSMQQYQQQQQAQKQPDTHPQQRQQRRQA